ncbi:MAG TPA: sugar ABC transporter permease [Acidimicrobiaceae bacterium]|nr:sugar ABC transporter permease [Acidimicrobiaceae bacterium]HCV36884.1 sugar ABC transporter permease [Acidimicrobiaceae bacterium]HJO78994.1 ABC transporter permease [Acidimicrobiales bacterium]
MKGSRILMALAAPVSAFVFSILISSVVLITVGTNPLEAWSEMLSFGIRLETLIETSNRATPLYLAGIAVAIGFRMNLFNIGVEGQYTIAALLAASAGAAVSLPAPMHVLLIMVVAIAVGSMFSGVAGYLKVTRGVHEVISTIMLNAIALSMVGYLMRTWLADPDDTTLNLKTREIAESGRFPNLNDFLQTFTRDIKGGRELDGFLIIAVIVGVVFHLYLTRTRSGYDLRITGLNPFAAEASGVDPKATVVKAMLLSGAVAGLIGMPEILGQDFKYDLSFTKGLGFAGIAVALIGRNHPAGIAIGALFFGWLDSAAPILDVRGDAPREIVSILQGVVVLSAVVAYEVVSRIRRTLEARDTASATVEPAAAIKETAETGQ